MFVSDYVLSSLSFSVAERLYEVLVALPELQVIAQRCRLYKADFGDQGKVTVEDERAEFETIELFKTFLEVAFQHFSLWPKISDSLGTEITLPFYGNIIEYNMPKWIQLSHTSYTIAAIDDITVEVPPAKTSISLNVT